VGDAFHVRLEIDLAGGRGERRARNARCLASVTQKRRTPEGHALVLKYWPLTLRSHYVLQQYFLGSSLAPARARPPRKHLFAASEVVPPLTNSVPST